MQRIARRFHPGFINSAALVGNAALLLAMSGLPAIAAAQDIYRAADGSIQLKTPNGQAAAASLPQPSEPSLPPASAPVEGRTRSEIAQRLPEAHALPPSSASSVAKSSHKPGAGAITFVTLHNTSNAAQANTPLTFAQVFAPGDLKRGVTLQGRTSSGTLIPLQQDVKALHADGSVRHAVFSALVPALAPNASLPMDLVRMETGTRPAPGPAGTAAAADKGATAETVLPGASVLLNLSLDGKSLHASAEEALKRGKRLVWLDGPVVREVIVSMPLTGADGAAHPHLLATFAIRTYRGAGAAGTERKASAPATRIDVTVENDWAFEPGPKNLTYDFDLQIDHRSVAAQKALVHYHHARWRKVFWHGASPAIEATHDPAYLINTRAVPNYDQRITMSDKGLQEWKDSWKGGRTETMNTGMTTPGMPTTGGRRDIGLLPAWAASYVMSADLRARLVTLGTGDQAGSFPIHYRDKNTGRPVSLVNFPYMTLLGREGDTVNPATKKSEAFPGCGGDCKTPTEPDSPHQPSLNYLPYLVTGDFYQLEELQFWTMYNVFRSNPGYREAEKGLLKSEQVRGQAWSLRTLGEAAYITPDNDLLKPQLLKFLSNNLAWYNAKYSNNPESNRLGVILDEAIAYDKDTGIAPWQDDFFTQAVGHVAELGFDAARPLLRWKSKFPIARMTDPEFCWISGAIYALKVRENAKAPIYRSIGESYRASRPEGTATTTCGSSEMAAAMKLKTGEMSGYAYSEMGYPSNMQPALAYSADVGGEDGAKAWSVFERRSVKPDYSTNPQFAIVPRK